MKMEAELRLKNSRRLSFDIPVPSKTGKLSGYRTRVGTPEHVQPRSLLASAEGRQTHVEPRFLR